MSTAIPVDDPAVSSATTTVAEDVDEDGSFTAAGVSKLRSATVHENESLPLEYQSPDPAHTSIPQLEDFPGELNLPSAVPEMRTGGL